MFHAIGSLADATPAAAVPGVSPPLGVLFVLVVVLAASWVTLWVLIRRSTSHRRWVALSEWARESGFRFRPEALAHPPPPLDALRGAAARVRICLADGRTTLVEFEATRSAPGALGGVVAAEPQGGAAEWRVLIRRIEVSWPPTGVRPAQAAASLLDLYSLASFPLLGNSERFVVYGTDSAAARALGRSSVRALLPPDVGLLLHGRHILLDFSQRPFDGIEFERMIAVADQLVAHLPVP